ncbi:hypothetical protein JP75_24745 [Devosia riboflavina]|uniref:Uncharacterized protein n=1 Tax=Devosia riboflavina TaxID=46914 RepID=A0A087LUQ3_9HYPH|nr:hypothetical protein [Devosia riboflavina]KFL28356.1 hypothetical protein JP75_24745 [Devosia riboflavina]
MHVFKTITLAALMVGGAAVPVFAEDAMAPALDAMAPATDAMAPQAMISNADLELCLTQAAAITFPEAMTAATVACNGLHEGMDVIGAIRSLGMDEKMEANPMAGGAMAPAM